MVNLDLNPKPAQPLLPQEPLAQQLGNSPGIFPRGHVVLISLPSVLQLLPSSGHTAPEHLQFLCSAVSLLLPRWNDILRTGLDARNKSHSYSYTPYSVPPSHFPLQPPFLCSSLAVFGTCCHRLNCVSSTPNKIHRLKS